MSSRREEIAQRKPLGMVSSGLLRKQRGAAPLAPRAARYRRLYRLGVLRTFERSVVGGTTNLADPTRRKANFLWKFLCAGDFPLCDEDPRPPSKPAPQGFLQSKNALRRTSLPNLLLGTKIVRLFTNQWVLACQKESASKIRRRLPHWKGNANLELPGSQKGRSPFVSEGVQRKPF